MKYIATIALLGFLLPAAAASAPAHCQGYSPEELEAMEPAPQIQWLTEELAQCDYNEEGRAIHYLNRGRSYHELGEFDFAIEDFDRAIALVPDNSVAYNNRGTTYHELGEFSLAIADFDRAIALDPDNVSAYNNRASAACLLRVPRTPLALEDVLMSIQLMPQRASQIQEFLRSKGFYHGPVDGNFDEASQAAFRAYCDS